MSADGRSADSGDVRTGDALSVGVEGKPQEPVFDACLVKVEELWEPGYIVDKNFDGTLTVFVPQAPTLAYGHVYVADPSQLKMLGIDSVALNARLKQLGKGVITAQSHTSKGIPVASTAVPATH